MLSHISICVWTQPSTAGLLPPSDSDSDEDSEEEPPPKPKKELQPAVADAPKPYVLTCLD